MTTKLILIMGFFLDGSFRDATLYWEHDMLGTPGFVIEESIDLMRWEDVGYVDVTNIWQNNFNSYTYRFDLPDCKPSAFYRLRVEQYPP